MFTRGQWATDLLVMLGNMSIEADTLFFAVGWTTAETLADSGAKYNLLNTTQPAPDATDFNSVHVKNYTSYREGIQDTVWTLQNGFYPHLSKALETNDIAALSGPSPEILAELNVWCGHCNYGKDFIALGQQHMNDQFNYGNAPEGKRPMLQNYGPGSKDFDQYFVALDDNRWQCKKTGNVIQFDIKKFFETLSRDGQTLPIIGLPLTGELYETYNGGPVPIVVQFFERAVCVYNPSHSFDSQPGADSTFLAKYDDPFIVSLDQKRKATIA